VSDSSERASGHLGHPQYLRIGLHREKRAKPIEGAVQTLPGEFLPVESRYQGFQVANQDEIPHVGHPTRRQPRLPPVV